MLATLFTFCPPGPLDAANARWISAPGTRRRGRISRSGGTRDDTPEGYLERVVECGSFALAIAFVGRVALLAEASRHHPEIDVRHGTVRLALTTPEAGGVTARDTDLADWIERVVP